MTKKLKIPIKSSKQVESETKFLVSASEVKKMIEGGKNFKLIDIRTEQEYKMLHIEGALLATREFVEKIFTEWSKDTPIVICDHTGAQALPAVKSLDNKGFTNIKAIAGGIDSWSETVDPLIPRY